MIKNFTKYIKEQEGYYGISKDDIIIVNNNLYNYITSLDWEGMEKFVGEVFIVDLVEFEDVYLKPKEGFEDVTEYYFPIDCCDLYDGDGDLEDKKQNNRIRWYKNGKLVEEKIKI